MATIQQVTEADERARQKRRKQLQQRKKALRDAANKQLDAPPVAKRRARKKAVTE